ncbi:MAG: TasA family protein [Clostridia bacterium]
MKKIILSLAIVGVVGTVAIGGTIAYFSDTETSTGNTFTAGTVDISVDSEDPWESTGQYSFGNLEPSDSEDINVTLSNTGSNDVVVWKKVKVSTETGNLSTQFVYSMKIGGNDNIKKDWDVKVSDVNDLWIPIGRINAGESLTVDQNYYFDEAADNTYQGTSMTIDITFYADQINAPGPAHTTRGVVLENKNTVGEWEPIIADGIWGILTFDGSNNFIVKGWGLTGASYRAVYYNGSTETNIGSGDTSVVGGEVTITGNYDFSSNVDAKYWLRDAGWNNVNTLWESNLVN